MYIYSLNGKQITGAFNQNGISYPANWCKLATDDELNAIGIVKELAPVPPPPPQLTQEQLLQQASEAVRFALQAAIDDKAKSFGFSSGNALMLYAGFTNPFQSLAQVFATWEATVWVEAGAYKDEVIAGTKPMLTGEQAVALMPVYPN
jgi:hypothetical protein